MRHGVLLLLLAVLLSPLSAGEARAANEPKAHDAGFFMRLSAGFGGAGTSADVDFLQTGTIDELKYTGAGSDLNFAFGGIVAPNLALHGTLFGWAIAEPDLEFGGTEFPTDDVMLMLLGYGGGATYYLGASNVYLSASVGAAELNLEVEGVTYETDVGWAVQGMAGKEWWVGGKWGLGVAVDFGYHSVPDRDGTTYSGSNWGVLFSATFN